MAKLSPIGIAVTAFTAVGLGILGYNYSQPELTPEELENQEPFFGASTQETNDIKIERHGRKYSIWEGLVIETLDSGEITGINELSLYKYDYDLELVIGLTKKDSFNRLFNELGNTDHLDRVKLIGCEITQQYFDRATTPHYNEAPNDVTAFHQRHCL